MNIGKKKSGHLSLEVEMGCGEKWVNHNLHTQKKHFPMNEQVFTIFWEGLLNIFPHQNVHPDPPIFHRSVGLEPVVIFQDGQNHSKYKGTQF